MRVSIPGPAGRLDGVLWRPDGEPRAAAVVCHPHPLYGGTKDNAVVFRIARGLQRAGLAVLRFDFRGAGESEGAHDGEAEVGDLAAALDWLAEAVPGVELWAAGFSFGARIVCALEDGQTGRGGVRRRLLVALPVRTIPCEAARRLPAPALVLMAGDDEHGTRADLEERYPELAGRVEIDEIPGADHLFTRARPELERRVGDWARRVLDPGGVPR